MKMILAALAYGGYVYGAAWWQNRQAEVATPAVTGPPVTPAVNSGVASPPAQTVTPTLNPKTPAPVDATIPVGNLRVALPNSESLQKTIGNYRNLLPRIAYWSGEGPDGEPIIMM